MAGPVRTLPHPMDLTLEECIGQVLCFGWSGENPGTVNDHARALVEAFHVGGVVLLGRNVGTPEKTRTMLDELQSLTQIPLLAAIDHEGGMVCRFQEGLHPFPGNMALGAIKDPDERHQLAYRQGRAQGLELRAVGVNWNFAPCLDVNSNPDNPIIGVRSFGEDPRAVAELGTHLMAGLRDAGVVSCVKHFPGHGDTSVDSHLGLPTVHGDWERLWTTELAPFRTAIAAGAPAVMTSHIVFPALDPHRPATVSHRVLVQLLRENLNFDGVVITDCLEMAAVAQTLGTPRAAVLALKAGVDMVLVCHTFETQREVVKAIHAAVASGELPAERLREAAGRVLALKHRYLNGTRLDEPMWLCKEHDELEREIARASITLVRDRGILPLPQGSRVAVASAHAARDVFVEAFRRHGLDALPVPVGLGDGPLIPHDTLACVLTADYTVVLTAPREPWVAEPVDPVHQAEFVRKLHAIGGDRLIVAAIREPYDIRLFPEVGTYLCTYGYRSCSLEALAEVMAGKIRPTGRLPVSIPGLS